MLTAQGHAAGVVRRVHEWAKNSEQQFCQKKARRLDGFSGDGGALESPKTSCHFLGRGMLAEELVVRYSIFNKLETLFHGNSALEYEHAKKFNKFPSKQTFGDI